MVQPGLSMQEALGSVPAVIEGQSFGCNGSMVKSISVAFYLPSTLRITTI